MRALTSVSIVACTLKEHIVKSITIRKAGGSQMMDADGLQMVGLISDDCRSESEPQLQRGGDDVLLAIMVPY